MQNAFAFLKLDKSLEGLKAACSFGFSTAKYGIVLEKCPPNFVGRDYFGGKLSTESGMRNDRAAIQTSFLASLRFHEKG